MADKFEDLRTFIAVVSCGGINAAAAEIGIAKSAVSRRISDLETRLGITLIERTTRRFDVTAVGRDYFRRATELLAALKRLDTDPAGRVASGVVSVSGAHDVLAHLVATALPGFLALHADLTLRFIGLDGDADLTISTTPTAGGDARRIASSTMILCAAPGYLAKRGTPSAVADLDGHAGIVLGDAATWTFRGAASRRPREATEAPDVDVAVGLAIAGLGIAQVPGHAIRDALRDRRLVALLGGEEPPPLDVMARYAADASPQTRALADHLATQQRASIDPAFPRGRHSQT